MKKILLVIYLTLIGQSCFSQQNDYDVLIAIFKDLKNFHPNDSIRLYENALEFDRQEIFFTRTFLESYTHPTVGVDTLKITKLLKEIDLTYLRNNKRENQKWDLKELPEAVILYSDNSDKLLNEKEQYKISRPIYTQDRKTAFVYSYDICGYIDCSNYNVRIYKKKKKKWEFYAWIPITL